MKAKEVRIGNYMLIDGEVGQVYEIHSYVPEEEWGVNGIADQYDPQDIKYPKVEPIPLIEEWLVKLGFTQDGWNSNCWTKISENNEDIDVYFDWYDKKYIYERVFLTSVHQLQNLYFALTGEELTLKP